MSELNLEEIAQLIHEYHELIRKGDSGTPENRGRLSRVEYLLSQVTLTGEQIMEMQTLDPLLLGNNDVKRSAIYEELKEGYDKLRRKHDGLQDRYSILVRKVEEEFGSQFRLKDLIDEQRKDAERDY